MTCGTCKHWKTKTLTPKGGHWLIFGCPIEHITFGNEADWRNKKNQPKNCNNYSVEAREKYEVKK